MADQRTITAPGVTRRETLKWAVSAAGGALAGVSLEAAAAAFSAASSGQQAILGAEVRHRLDRVCDLLLPETDTPGALAAGVPNFLEHLLANWASADSQEQFTAGLASVENKAHEHFGAPFTQLGNTQQYEALRQVDIEAMSSADHPFRLVKKLVIFAYYTSEAGASQELRIDPVPGAYGCTPAAEDERAWATNKWRNDL
jgi:gluconate 2-dehydrogenase gamma chain